MLIILLDDSLAMQVHGLPKWCISYYRTSITEKLTELSQIPEISIPTFSTVL